MEESPQNDTKDPSKTQTKKSIWAKYDVEKMEQKILNSPFILARRVLFSYGFFIGGACLFIIGVSLTVFTFYIIRNTDDRVDIDAFSKFGIKVASVIYLLIFLFILSKLMAFMTTLAKEMWNNKDEMYVHAASNLISFFGGDKTEHSRMHIALRISLLFICEFVPFVLTIIFISLHGPGNLIVIVNFYALSTACLLTCFATCCWFGSIIDNYKRFIQLIIYIISAKKINFKCDNSCNNDDTDAHTQYKHTESVFYHIIYAVSYYKPFKSPAIFKNITMKHIVLLIIGVFACIGMMYFGGWERFATPLVMLIIFFVIGVIEFIIGLINYPALKPSKKRAEQYLRREGFLSYLIALYEEVNFKQTPYVVFSNIRAQAYALVLVAFFGLMVINSMTYEVIIPLMTLSFPFLFYFLRFAFPDKKIKEKKEEEGEKEEEEEVLMYKNESKMFRFLSVVSYFGYIVLWLFVFLVFSFIYLNWYTGFISLFLLIIICGITFDKYSKKNTPLSLTYFYSFLIFFSIVFMIGTPAQHKNEQVIDENEPGRRIIEPGNIAHSDNRYEICDLRWNGLNIYEIGKLARFAYLSSFPLYLKRSNLSDFEHVTMYTSKSGLVLHDIYSTQRNMSIIAVRGTESQRDLIQDLYIWKEIVLLQLFSSFTPLLSTMGETLTRYLIQFSGYIEKFFITLDVSYADDLVNYVEKKKKLFLANKNTSETYMLLTGSSLGGGLAKIAGAKLGINAVSFAGPGMSYSSLKMGVTTEQLNYVVTNVNPDNDIVSKIDSSVGFTQVIGCKLNVIRCHLVGNVAKILRENCGFPSIIKT